MKRIITCQINGKAAELAVDLRQSLLEALRAVGLQGAKEGCGVGECGACTILVDGTPINGCIYMAVWADGKAIRTIEGEAHQDKLSPVQQAYVESGAVQCGFCTPGLILRTTAFIEKNRGKKVDRSEIRRAHAGNLCRCTGYHRVVDAVERSIALHEIAKQKEG